MPNLQSVANKERTVNSFYVLCGGGDGKETVFLLTVASLS